MNKIIITNDELKEITKQTWVTAKDIEKIACVSKKESYRLKKDYKRRFRKQRLLYSIWGITH